MNAAGASINQRLPVRTGPGPAASYRFRHAQACASGRVETRFGRGRARIDEIAAKETTT